MKKIRIIISGVVTGVGFRWWLKMIANERNVYGWVRNNAEKEVEAILIGNEEDVNYIIELCRKGPNLSNVKSIKIEDYKKIYLKKTFDILYEKK